MFIVAASRLPYHSFPLWYSIALDFSILYEVISSAGLHKAVQSFQFIDLLEIPSVTQRPHFMSGRKVIEKVDPKIEFSQGAHECQKGSVIISDHRLLGNFLSIMQKPHLSSGQNAMQIFEQPK